MAIYKSDDFMNMGNMGEERRVEVSAAIINSLGVSTDELKRQMIELKSTLGAKFEQIVPTQISDFSTLDLAPG